MLGRIARYNWLAGHSHGFGFAIMDDFGNLVRVNSQYSFTYYYWNEVYIDQEGFFR